VLLNASPRAEIHISIPASSGRGVALVNSSIPAVVPAPPPPSAQLQVSTPVPSSMPSSLPQAVPAPVPDLQ
jgi:hypothetical protein